MNTWIGRGNLGAQPTIKTSNGTTYALFSIAINQRDREGNQYADWYKVVAFGKLAESLDRLDSGDEVLVTGSLHRTKYEKDGSEYHDVEVRARAVEFLRLKQRPQDAETSTSEAAGEAPEVSHAADLALGEGSGEALPATRASRRARA